MRRNAGTILFALAVGYALAHFAVVFYNHWYFGGWFWVKVGLVTTVAAATYGFALCTSWAKVWRVVGAWWVLTHLLAMVPAGGPDLRNMAFVAVLDFEVAFVWVPGGVLLAYGLYRYLEGKQAGRSAARKIDSELRLRRRLRKYAAKRGQRPAIANTGEPAHGE